MPGKLTLLKTSPGYRIQLNTTLVVSHIYSQKIHAIDLEVEISAYSEFI